MKLTISLVCLLFIIGSCSDRYLPLSTAYKLKSETGRPDYSNLDYWAAHPAKSDPSDSVPLPFADDARDTLADVFFIYPTVFTGKQRKNKLWNAPIDDPYLSAKADYSSILYQASVFNGSCRIFAPRYRQAHISAFFSDNPRAEQAFDTAYQDLRTAFKHYLLHENHGRPIIIAGHSQGAMMGFRLLREFFDNKPLANQLVAAYLPGWQLPPILKTIPACTSATAIGCLAGWRTLRRNYMPKYLRNEQGGSIVVNPLNWDTAADWVPDTLNKGSLLYDFNKLFEHTTGATIHENVLWIRKPKFPKGKLYLTRNYHIGDINLFYQNIRENVAVRIREFLK